MRRLKPAGAQLMRALVAGELRRSAEQRFAHRLHAVMLVAAGRSCYEIARWFGDDPRTIERWVHAFDAHGAEGLREHHAGGRPARLSPAQAAAIDRIVHQRPEASGVSGKRWNGRLLAQYLAARFGVRLGIRQCQRLLQRAN